MGAIHLAPRSCGVLSGGERQRVLSLVADLAHDLHRTIVVVLHDLNLAARYCDDLVLLDGGGRIAAAGPVGEVLVPGVLEPVYGIGIERIQAGGHPQLLFHPVNVTVEENTR